MKNIFDFNVDQIDKDTKAVVFKLPFREMDFETYDHLVPHLDKIKNELAEIGILAIFVDSMVGVESLTNEFLQQLGDKNEH